MKKIGFIDYFLDEWHANNYPKFIKDAVGDEFVVAYAYGEIDSPNGQTNREWADSFGVELLGTIDEVIEKSDVLIVLSPDHPERHWDLCQKPFRSGKRVYVDKTFAPSKKIAEDLVKLAESLNEQGWVSFDILSCRRPGRAGMTHYGRLDAADRIPQWL